MSTMSANANEPATTITISAAEVTIRPLRSSPCATAVGLSAVCLPALAHPAEQEHLVVHRQPEQDAEQDHRLGRLHEPERPRPEQRREVAVLEDPDERAERGEDRQACSSPAPSAAGARERRRSSSTRYVVTRMNSARPRELRADARDDVLDVGRAAADEDRHAPGRAERTGVRAQVARRARGPTGVVRPVGRGDRERGQVAARRRRECLGDEAVRRAVAAAIEQLRTARASGADRRRRGCRRARSAGRRPAGASSRRARRGSSGSVAGPGVRIARTIGANGPGPNSSVSRSNDCRDGTDSGRIRASGALNRTCRNGVPSSSRTASVGTSTATGRRMTHHARRDQRPLLGRPGDHAPHPQPIEVHADDREERRQQRHRRRRR